MGRRGVEEVMVDDGVVVSGDAGWSTDLDVAGVLEL